MCEKSTALILLLFATLATALPAIAAEKTTPKEDSDPKE